MSLIIGLDLGTTTITALALDASTGDLAALATAPNEAETTSVEDKAKGRSEWDANGITDMAFAVLLELGGKLGPRAEDVAGMGLTGQQHGVVVVDGEGQPLTPFVNWQDRRAMDPMPESDCTYLDRMAELAGPDYARRTGCRLYPGFLGVTLFWLKENRLLPSGGTACFVTDHFASLLTGEAPATDPTNGSSSGLLNVTTRDWDGGLIETLGLRQSLFPEVREAGDPLGTLSAEASGTTGLPVGTPVFVGLGDNQASFVGAVADRTNTVLVNVGTGGQVSMYSDDFVYAPPLETRPFPRGGYLVTEVGLCGGRSYAALERFFQQVLGDLRGEWDETKLYETMNELARSVQPGADGLRCEPFFTGTRAEPERRATWTGMSDRNFTPAHMTRALLEGMARAFAHGREAIAGATDRSCQRLVGSGNGLRENPVLTQIVAGELGMPVVFPHHHEEAAYGAALVASVGAGIFSDLRAAGQLVRYEEA